jgi:uncharacterized glyoxalase superfamily protein PhnB
MKVSKITAVLQVDEVETVLPFWEERLGFKRTMEIPHGGGIGFAILVHGGEEGGVEVMLGSTACAKDDIPAIARPASPGSTGLYVEVDALEPFLARILPGDIASPQRETFYGTKEIVLRDPAGHVVILSARK